jgi:NAD(P)-dependent dehydrogenase (short-subunit alcohol dehydrogenase family)
MPTLEGKIAIVTGGGQGVGRGIALALSAEGATVAITGRTPAKLDATVAEIGQRGGRAIALPGDVKIEADIARTVDAVVKEFGTIDILVNNAQEVTLGPLLDMQRGDFESGWLSGPLAAFSFMKACHPHLCGGGVIINLVTSAALRPDGNNYGVYSAVKEAMRSLTRTAACEWGPQGVRVVTCCHSRRRRPSKAWSASRPDEAAAFVATVPLQRVGDSEADIGRIAVFLCGPTRATSRARRSWPTAGRPTYADDCEEVVWVRSKSAWCREMSTNAQLR